MDKSKVAHFWPTLYKHKFISRHLYHVLLTKTHLCDKFMYSGELQSKTD